MDERGTYHGPRRPESDVTATEIPGGVVVYSSFMRIGTATCRSQGPRRADGDSRQTASVVVAFGNLGPGAGDRFGARLADEQLGAQRSAGEEIERGETPEAGQRDIE
jgi:hypothetical protein